MYITVFIATVILSANLIAARPLGSDLYEIVMEECEPKVEWTDSMIANIYKLSTNTENDADIADRHIDSDNLTKNKKHSDQHRSSEKTDINIDSRQLSLDNRVRAFIDNNNESILQGDTQVIMKPDELETLDTTIIDYASTKNAVFSTTSDEYDYIRYKDVVASIQDLHREESSILDFFELLDHALLDPLISSIDSDLNREVYEIPVAETTTTYHTFDPCNLITEQISLSEEILQDQQQIDDLKSKIHHSSSLLVTITIIPALSSSLSLGMEDIESGPNEAMLKYKRVGAAPTSTIIHPLVNKQQQQQQQQSDVATASVLHLSTNAPLLLSTDDFLDGKKEEPIYSLTQKQTVVAKETRVIQNLVHQTNESFPMVAGCHHVELWTKDCTTSYNSDRE